MNIDHFRKLERMYQTAPINRFYRPVMRIDEGTAELTIPVAEHLFHAAHAVHGAVYAKAADDAMFFAVNSLVTETFVLTVSLNLSLVRPIAAGEIRAAGRVTFSSASLFTAEAVITDADGREIGRGTGVFVRGKTPLTPEIGYQ